MAIPYYILDANYEQHKMRLAGIDAPERKQAYRLAPRKHLASIVAGKQVTNEEPRIALVILRGDEFYTYYIWFPGTDWNRRQGGQ